MRNQIKILVAALIVATMVFSTGCPPAAEQAPDNTAASPPVTPGPPDDLQIPNTCSAGDINTRIEEWFERWESDRPTTPKEHLANQYSEGKFKIYAQDVVRDGVTYAELIVSGKISRDGTLQALNGILQPLTKARSGNKRGPCVTAVKYVTVAPDGASQTEDFEWVFCPVGTEPCSDGTCSANCGSGKSWEQ